MNKKSYIYLFMYITVIAIIYVLLNKHNYPFSKTTLVDTPEVAIVQKMHEYKPQTKVEDIKILGQIGNNKQRFILFECSGKPKSAFAVSGIFGGRYDLCIGDENPNSQVDFVLHDYFYERHYTYFGNEFTLTESTYRMHDDVRYAIGNFILILVVSFLAERYRGHRNNVNTEETE